MNIKQLVKQLNINAISRQYKPKFKSIRLRKKVLTYNQRECILSIYFGPPGSGKSTLAALDARKRMKKGYKVFSNVPITGTYKINPKQDLGNFMVENALIIIDEASIEYNNRRFKEMPTTSIEFFKYHRHYQTAINLYSQSWDDVDITLRRLCQNVYYIKRTILPWFIKVHKIRKSFTIIDGEIRDSYEPVPWSTKYRFTPPAWKMFNTISREHFPEKVWEKY